MPVTEAVQEGVKTGSVFDFSVHCTTWSDGAVCPLACAGSFLISFWSSYWPFCSDFMFFVMIKNGDGLCDLRFSMLCCLDVFLWPFAPLAGYRTARTGLTCFGSSLAAAVVQWTFLSSLGVGFLWKWKIIGWRQSFRSCFLFWFFFYQCFAKRLEFIKETCINSEKVTSGSLPL